jgi:hypothetical protein
MISGATTFLGNSIDGECGVWFDDALVITLLPIRVLFLFTADAPPLWRVT